MMLGLRIYNWVRYLKYIELTKMQSQKNDSMAKYLSKEQIQQIAKAFRIFDQDSSGEISIREFDQILKSLGHTLPEEQLQIIIQRIDKDGNGFINFEEFLDLVAPTMLGNRSEKRYIDAFRLIDQKNDGILDFEQLIKANKMADNPLNQQQVNQILNYVKLKYSSSLNFSTVLKMMLRRLFL